MKRVVYSHYELGRSGHPVTILAGKVGDIERSAPHLSPGSYWVIYFEIGYDGRKTSTDWGTLEVGDDGNWCLRSLAGYQSGPSYMIV